MADVAYIPDQNQANNMLPYFLAGQNNGNGGFFGGNGGSAFWGALLGSVVPGFLGAWNGGGNGFGIGGGNGAAAASLGAQATANNNSALIQQAIAGTDADIRLLATTLNGDVDSLKLGINTIQGAIAQVGSQVGMSGLQVINAINSGNADLASKLCSCCCEMRQLTVEQGYQNQIRTLEQTNALSGQSERNTRAVTDAIAAQSAMINDGFCKIQNREYESRIEALKTELANATRSADKAEILGSVSAMLAPIAGQVASIKQSMPPTVSVPYPQLTAIQTAPGLEYLTNAAILGTLFRNIVSGGTTDTTTPTTPANA